VNCLYYLKALSFWQMRAMINYRIGIARESEITQSLFTFWGLALIYASTGGYPRKIVSLCHQVILMLIIRGKKKAGLMLVKNSIREMSRPLFLKTRWAMVSILIIVVLGFSAGAFFTQRLGADTSAVKLASIVSKTSVNTSNENLTVNQKIENTMPGSLGTIRISKGSTIWQISQNVYGSTESEVISAVIKANQQIKDANKIPAGAFIKIPSIPSANVSVKKGDFIIQIEEGKNIENIYNAFSANAYRQSMSRVVFFPIWNKKEEEIKFAVIINKCFTNMRDIENAIEKLPHAVAAKTKILSQLDENTVIFNRTILLR
jgi:general secretion pathway protein A